MGRRVSIVAIVVVLLLPSVGAAQTERPQTASDCAVAYRDPAYVTWICNADGTAYSDTATLVRVRTSQAGVIAFTPVWTGNVDVLVKQIDAVVNVDAAAHRGCETYFHIAGFERGQIRWNAPTPNMQKWWTGEGQRSTPSVCYTPTPSFADYLVVWQDYTETTPYRFSVPVPQTTYTSGSVNAYGSGGSAYGTYSGSTTTTTMQTYSATRSEWNVMVTVYPMVARGEPGKSSLGDSIFSTEKSGRWRWSKPDKDGLREAVRTMSDRKPVAAPSLRPSAPPSAATRQALATGAHGSANSAAAQVEAASQGALTANLPGTTVEVRQSTDGVRMAFLGGEFNGVVVLLRRNDRGMYFGEYRLPQCERGGVLEMAPNADGWVGSIERVSCTGTATSARVGLLLRRP